MSQSKPRGSQQLADREPAEARDYRWLVGPWVVVALFALVTALRSDHVGIGVRDPGGDFFRLRLLTSIGLFAVFALVDAGVRTAASGRSIHTVVAELRRRWPVGRLTTALTGLVAYYTVYVCYHNLKSWDAFNKPQDALLHRVDSWLFLGHSPAVVLHDLLGQHLATYVLVVVYESFGYLVTISVVAALVFTERIRDGYVFLTSSLWVWILGVGSYYLIPSLGPFQSAPQDFAQLPHTIITSTQAQYLSQRAYFLQHPTASDAFAQVSAFASLHVGFTCMIVLMLRYYGLRRATRALSVYLAATVVATIYLGWHFAVDDIAGLLLAYIAVRLGRATIYPRGPRPAP